jgi:hypothetical protein
MIAELAAPVILGAGFRLRGAALFERITGRGATTARIVCFATPAGLLAWATGFPWPYALAMGVAAWLGCLPPWWGSLDLGRHAGGYARDFALHTLRGVVWVAPMAAVAFLAGAAWWPLILAGLMCGAVYEAGYRVSERHGTEIGEAAFGALIGAGLALA